MKKRDGIKGPSEEFVIKRLKEGYSPCEIVESDETHSLVLSKILEQKKRMIALGIVTKEELNNAVKKRQKEKIDKEHAMLIDLVKKYAKLGYSIRETAKKIERYEYSYILKVKKEYEKEHGWFTKEELKQFAQERRRRELKAILEKGQEQEAKSEEKIEEPKDEDTMKEENKKTLKLKTSKNRAYKSLNRKVKMYRLLAKREDKQDYKGIDNVPITNRERYIEFLISMQEQGKEIETIKEDITLFMDFFYRYPELITIKAIKFLIIHSGKVEGYEGLYKMTSELLPIVEDKPYRDAVAEFNIWARKMTRIPDMKKMKKRGMSHTEIADRLRMSSTEVSILLDENNQIIDFFEGEKQDR